MNAYLSCVMSTRLEARMGNTGGVLAGHWITSALLLLMELSSPPGGRNFG